MATMAASTVFSRGGRALRCSSSSRSCSTSTASEFPHHFNRGKLNHASFGAAPESVLAAQRLHSTNWHADADAHYFTGQLHAQMGVAADAMAPVLGVPAARSHELCLMENASACTNAIGQRWSWAFREGQVCTA